MLRRRCLSVVLAALLLTAMTACEGVTVKEDDPEPMPSAASKEDGVEVWDLRQRPTTDEVGIDSGKTSVYETDEPRRVRLRLAGSTSVELATRYIAFSTILSRDGDPVSVDVKTAMMPLDDNVAAFETILEQLGHPTSAVDEFQRNASRASGHEWVVSDRIAATYGALELGVIARYSPHSERGIVTLAGNWIDAS